MRVLSKRISVSLFSSKIVVSALKYNTGKAKFLGFGKKMECNRFNFGVSKIIGVGSVVVAVVGYPQAMKAISLRRRGGAHDSALRSNGAGRDPRNPGRAVTKGMKADFKKSVDGRAEKVTVLKRNIKNYLNKK
ncbi:MAG: hypothetical protein II039_10130 [Treponema sp.]|nr:hypothetical protein [Treponema sp.]